MEILCKTFIGRNFEYNMRIVSSLFYLIKQRFAILVIAFFLAIVLFNTTYLGLGTYVPLFVIFLGLLTF